MNSRERERGCGFVFCILAIREGKEEERLYGYKALGLE